MPKKLEELMLESIQNVAGVSQNPYLMIRFSNLVDVMRFVEQTPDAAYADVELRALFSVTNWALDAKLVEKFFQLTGELQFWLLAERGSIKLERIPEGKFKTPDFRLMSDDPAAPRFEVKTLSVVDGWRALDKIHEDSFEGQLDLQVKIQSGSRIAMHEQSVSPHGSVKRGQEVITMCRNLINKTAGNIKQGQYADAPTFLVLNMTLIDSHWTGNAYLRPVAAGYPNNWSVHTGVLWTLAFGSEEQMIHGEPEFEGLPAIEGILSCQGILANPEFESVAGLILMLHRMSADPVLYGLWRSKDWQRWNESSSPMCTMLCSLTGSNWNDELDSNGWQLTSHI